MNAVEIKKDIYWVGVKDWNLSSSTATARRTAQLTTLI